MKRLLLLRHAKAVPADPGIEDHERDLLPRGRQDAPSMGRYMAESEYVPDAVLCSTSRRTVETAELILAELPGTPTIDYVETLYLATPPALLAAVRGVADNAQTLLLVGHNPGIERVAAALAREPVRRKERDRFDLIEEKFPTAALAVLDFAVPRWRDVAPGQGELIDFVRPAISEAPTLDELTARIRAVFADLKFTEAKLITHGDDNLVVVLDQTWIVRFPRNDDYRARFAAELNLLDHLRPLSSLAVPNYEMVAPDKSFGAYRMIAGREMTPDVFAALAPHEKQAALSSLSAFLSVLHALPAYAIMQPDGMIARTWSGEQFAALYRGMRRARIARVVSPTMLARFDAFHDAFEPLEPGPARLVHDDISDDHILIDEANPRIAGIVDFSDASFGDPAIDFAFFWRLGEASLDHVLAGYRFGSEDPALKVRSHWTFVRYMINQLAYGAAAKWRQSVEQTLAELEPHLVALGL